MADRKTTEAEREWADRALSNGIREMINMATPSQVGPDEDDLKRIRKVLRDGAMAESTLRAVLDRNRVYVERLHAAIAASDMAELKRLMAKGVRAQAETPGQSSEGAP